MTDPSLDDLRAVAEAATPGPWSVHRNPSRRDDTSVIAGRPGDPTYLAHYAMPQTATYIATFDPPAVLALLDRVASAERERDEALAQVARVRELHHRREHNAMDFVHFGQNEFPDWCDHCGRHWPCGTIVALDGREDDRG